MSEFGSQDDDLAERATLLEGLRMTRAYDWAEHHSRLRPSKLAMVDVATGRRLTWAEFNDRAARLANYLSNLGVQAGDRVAVLAHNSTNFFEIEFACVKLGSIMVPMNWRLAVPELQFISADCTPSVLIHDNETIAKASELVPITTIAHRVNWDPSTDDALDYEEGLRLAEPMEPGRRFSLDDVWTIMYTSGTTGRPKGVMLTYGMTFWNSVNQVEYYGLGPKMTDLIMLPMFHTGGLNCYGNAACHFGGTNVVMRAFDAAQTLALLSDPEIGITHFTGVPTNYIMMSQRPEFEAVTFPALESANIGGSMTPISVIKAWTDKGVNLQHSYGMTETGPFVVALMPEFTFSKAGSVGMAAMHMETKIVDANGLEITRDGSGELWVRGANVTPGYWNNPDETGRSIIDGWFHTGDVMRVDADGFLYVVDRSKDMYISGGENVFPAEVERVLCSLAGVSEAAVIGVPDERWQEAGCAYVVAAPGNDLDAGELLASCRALLAKYKVPRQIEVVAELPRNAGGKVVKQLLREGFAATAPIG